MIERFEKFCTAINQIHKNLQRIKMLEMTEFNLKGTHVMCLFELNHNEGGLTITQLSTLCSEDKAATSRTVRELTQKGLVTSDAEKKYRAPILLTRKGKQIADQIDTLVTQAVTAGSDGLTEKERSVFYKALFQISDNLNHYLSD